MVVIDKLTLLNKERTPKIHDFRVNTFHLLLLIYYGHLYPLFKAIVTKDKKKIYLFLLPYIILIYTLMREIHIFLCK